MRRYTIIFVVVTLLAGGGLFLASQPDLLSRLGIGGAATQLRSLTRSFIEDVQFKDFKKAARYHPAAEQDKVDIPFLLERLFMIKPEQLDVMEYEILFAKIDSSELRGRTKTRIKFKDLLREEIHERELMLYFYRQSKAGKWFMRLESSLRNLKGDPGKKH